MLFDWSNYNRGWRAARQKSPGPKRYHIPSKRRKIVFLEGDRNLLNELPCIRLDSFLERHMLLCRIRPGPCPLWHEGRRRMSSLASLKAGAQRGCPSCILGYFLVTLYHTEIVRAVHPNPSVGNLLLFSPTWRDYPPFQLFTTPGTLFAHTLCAL